MGAKVVTLGAYFHILSPKTQFAMLLYQTKCDHPWDGCREAGIGTPSNVKKEEFGVRYALLPKMED